MLAPNRPSALVPPFLTLLLAGCISTSLRPVSGATAEVQFTVAPEKVRVLRSLPDEPFLILGEIEAYLSGHHKDRAIITKVREKAAAIGADAIVYESDGLVTPVYGGGGEIGFPTTKRASVRFTAVRFLPSRNPIQTPGAT